MSDPTLADVLAKLDVIDARLAAITLPATTPVPRISYTRREFAVMIGREPTALRDEKSWRALGGKKIGGRIVFSESARIAVMEGKR